MSYILEGCSRTHSDSASIRWVLGWSMLKSFPSSVCMCQKDHCSLANAQRWDRRKAGCVLYQARAGAMFSACTKCLFTQILRTPLPVAIQEPGETLGFWHRWMVCPGSLDISCTEGSGSHHCWGSPDDCLGCSSWVEYGTGWAKELSIPQLKGQHIAGHPLFTWHKIMHAGLLPLLPTSWCALRWVDCSSSFQDNTEEAQGYISVLYSSHQNPFLKWFS